VAYAVEKRWSKHPERFGTGVIEGVAAPETANNAAAQASFIPLLALGLPANMEPYVSVARKNETIVGDLLTGQALADYVKKLNANYEQLIKEAGLYKSEKK
jgi:hypothetical protein